jgi:hypothetical protein
VILDVITRAWSEISPPQMVGAEDGIGCSDDSCAV